MTAGASACSGGSPPDLAGAWRGLGLVNPSDGRDAPRRAAPRRASAPLHHERATHTGATTPKWRACAPTSPKRMPRARARATSPRTRHPYRRNDAEVAQTPPERQNGCPHHDCRHRYRALEPTLKWRACDRPPARRMPRAIPSATSPRTRHPYWRNDAEVAQTAPERQYGCPHYDCHQRHRAHEPTPKWRARDPPPTRRTPRAIPSATSPRTRHPHWRNDAEVARPPPERQNGCVEPEPAPYRCRRHHRHNRQRHRARETTPKWRACDRPPARRMPRAIPSATSPRTRHPYWRHDAEVARSRDTGPDSSDGGARRSRPPSSRMRRGPAVSCHPRRHPRHERHPRHRPRRHPQHHEHTRTTTSGTATQPEGTAAIASISKR